MSDPPATASSVDIDADADAVDAVTNPVVRRRRRRIVRHVREKTPEPSTRGDRRGYQNDSDDDDDTTASAAAAANNDVDDSPQQRDRQIVGIDSRQRSAVATGAGDAVEGALTAVVAADPDNEGAVLTGHPSTTIAPATHRSKILTMRDRGVGTSKAQRSQSSPRVAEVATGRDAFVLGSGSIADGTREEMMGARQFVKRSMSSQRHPEELLNRHFSRDSRAPAREIPSTHTTPSPTDPASVASTPEQHQQLTKLERNLRRFEEERRRFEDEKRRFEQEKRDAETAQRNRRLQAFQRKRDERQQADAVDQEVHQKLCSILRVIEDSNKYHLPGISSSPVRRTVSGAGGVSGGVWRTSSGEDEHLRQASSTPPVPVIRGGGAVTKLPLEVLEYANDSSTGGEVAEDYESSTAKSMSSREGDFDDELLDNNGADEEDLTVMEELPAAVASATTADDGSVAQKNQTIDATAALPPSPPPPQRSWLARLLRLSPAAPPKLLPAPSIGPVSVWRFIFVETRLVWHQLLTEHDTEWQAARRCRNRCLADLVVLMLVCGLGGLTFRFVEGAFENFYKCGVRRVKRDFVDHLWTTSHNLREDDWKTLARAKLRSFEEELHAAHEAGMTSYSGMKAWTFVNGMIYCLTVITTIGYGHIVPSTNTGRVITIVYALIGIPLFLILLNDFGKYFTWRIKFMVAFLRRLGNTSSLGRIYRLVYVQKTVRLINKLYSFVIFKRNRAIITPDPLFKGSTLDLAATDAPSPPLNRSGSTVVVAIFRDSPIDDEFDLPVSVALSVLIAYIAAGSIVFAVLEDWSLFEAAYFAFVSMSTIGLGDYVPTYPAYMFGSIGYLVFGLALTSMCLTVLQNRLDGGFQRICSRIGAIIGLDIGQRSANAVLVSEIPAATQEVKQRNRKVKRRSASKVKNS